MRASLTNVSENKLRADIGIGEQAVDRVARFLEYGPSQLNLQDEHGKSDLQSQAPSHRLETNGAPVRGKNVAQSQHRQQTKNTSKSSHSVRSHLLLAARVE